MKLKADGQFVMRSTDQFTISGCSYTLGTTPHPCVRVKWDVHAERHQSDRDPSLSLQLLGSGSGGKRDGSPAPTTDRCAI